MSGQGRLDGCDPITLTRVFCVSAADEAGIMIPLTTRRLQTARRDPVPRKFEFLIALYAKEPALR